MALDNARGHQSLNISAAFSGIAALVVLLRLYTRCFVVRSLGVEDYFICLSMLCSIGFTITIGIQVQYGMGQHVWTVEPKDNRESLKAFFASLLLYNMSLSLTKASILLQYRRVFPTKKFRIACWIIIGIVFVYTLWTIFGNVFQCIPVSAFWTLDPNAWCMDQIASWFTNAALNIATDLAIIILPMPVIRTLNLQRRQKQLLAGIFAVGGFVCVVSILRLQSLAVISNSKDVTYDNPPAATWSSVEAHVGIICSCLPCLRPLLSRLLPRFFRGTTYRRNAHTAPPIYSRRAYGRHSSDIDFVLSEIEKEPKGKGASGDMELGHRGRDDVIEVITEVHVSVDDKSDAGTPVGKLFRLQEESSTEDLVRDARDAV